MKLSLAGSQNGQAELTEAPWLPHTPGHSLASVKQSIWLSVIFFFSCLSFLGGGAHLVAWGILVSWLGIESRSTVVKAQVLITTGLPWNSLVVLFWFKIGAQGSLGNKHSNPWTKPQNLRWAILRGSQSSCPSPPGILITLGFPKTRTKLTSPQLNPQDRGTATLEKLCSAKEAESAGWLLLLPLLVWIPCQ